jgi:acetate kinase
LIWHHNANLEGINVAEEIFSSAKQVAVFDTAPNDSCCGAQICGQLPFDGK